ncbi:hypothetical protein FHR32_002100 [Streptosporangium album]|uniref:Uncharacterized protein n=1 Tax=Streptosporangium album TaxID=47479 RepID=A0A7W7RTD0_9ACTN|nr:hypothetical protein [Streptosporangium album]MBB4937795.1 hypothetical protein [Streptosporangium album]
MSPSYITPAGDRLIEATRRPASGVVIQRLRTDLNKREIYPSIVYEKGSPRLVISGALTVWANHIGTVIYWGADPDKKPAGQAPGSDLTKAAQKIAEQVYTNRATL